MNHLRNPSKLWASLDDLCNENDDFNKKLEIRLSGNIDQKILDEIKAFPNLKSKLVFLGYLKHSEVIKEYSKANLLLLLLFNSKSGEGNYPGKIFEYIATKKPILSFGPNESDVKNFLKKGYGFYHSYLTESDSLKENILNIFNNENDKNDIDSSIYSRKFLTQKLHHLIEKI